MIVSDAGPIIIFARIGQLFLLQDVTGSLLIPDAVYHEIVAGKVGMPGAAEVAQASWIKTVSVSDHSEIAALPKVLHAGEREAIVLAKERDAQLLIDDLRGRRVARDQGVEVIGTLRILTHAKERDLIRAVHPIIEQMQSNGYRFERIMLRRFLDRVGEP